MDHSTEFIKRSPPFSLPRWVCCVRAIFFIFLLFIFNIIYFFGGGAGRVCVCEVLLLLVGWLVFVVFLKIKIKY